jgi:hypothetical protein
MRVFEEKQWFNQWWMQMINLGLLGLLYYFLYQWYVVGVNVDKVAANDYAGQVLVIVLLLFSIGLIYIFRLRTTIDERGIHYRFLPFHKTTKTISWKDLEDCEVRKYSPLSEYGGWGYKLHFGGNGALNVKGNMGIQLKLKSGKQLLIGTQKPEEAQLVINRYYKK